MDIANQQLKSQTKELQEIKQAIRNSAETTGHHVGKQINFVTMTGLKKSPRKRLLVSTNVWGGRR